MSYKPKPTLEPGVLFKGTGEATLCSQEGGYAAPYISFANCLDPDDVLERVLDTDWHGRYRLRVVVELLEDRSAARTLGELPPWQRDNVTLGPEHEPL